MEEIADAAVVSRWWLVPEYRTASLRFYVQPVKSMRATLVVEPAVSARGWLFASFDLVISEGEQSGTPPLIGRAALASTVKSTSPATGGA